MAVKVLHSGWGKTAEENLRTEAKLLCSLRFPNVLTFLTAYVNCYPMMIVTEYCAGGDLGRALRLDQGNPRRCASLPAQELLGPRFHAAPHQPEAAYGDRRLINFSVTPRRDASLA